MNTCLYCKTKYKCSASSDVWGLYFCSVECIEKGETLLGRCEWHNGVKEKSYMIKTDKGYFCSMRCLHQAEEWLGGFKEIIYPKHYNMKNVAK